MAPRRGSSGSSSGSSASSCPDAFQTTVEQASFANDVIFFVVVLGITVALCITRKKSAGKGLLGLPFIGCLLFFLLTYACSIISTVLEQCVTTDITSYYSWSIAIVIFSYISYWLFLVVIVFNLNAMLRRQLDVGHSNIVYKIIPLAIVGIMGLLSCALAGLSAYVYQSIATSHVSPGSSGLYITVMAQSKLAFAYWVLYLVSVLASGALALMTIFSLRKAGKAGGDLIGWLIALTIAIALSTIFSIVFASWNLWGRYNYMWERNLALAYLVNFTQALSFIFVLCIAKHASWGKRTTAESMQFDSAYQPVQQYGYNAHATGHAPQYHEAPELVDTNNHVKA